jgi:antitoxin (DNA-binding transcriptional repressor) of toxin-antitoxin stability system
MTTMTMERIETGDVIEITVDGEPMTALVLLASETAVILDACDGSTPFVVKRDELVDFRKFEPVA